MNPVKSPALPDPATLTLRGYRLPDPVSWWPPPIGWWLVFLLVLFLAGLVLLYLRYRKQQQWRKQSVELLDTIEKTFLQDNDPHLLASEISVLLRRVCLSRFPDKHGANLYGEEWLVFLDSCTKTGEKLFQSEIGRQLVNVAYNPSGTIDGEQLIRTCRRWQAGLPAKPWRMR